MLQIPKKELSKYYEVKQSNISEFADTAYVLLGAAVLRCAFLWKERYGSRGWNPDNLDLMSDAEILEKNSDIFFEAFVCDRALDNVYGFAIRESDEFRNNWSVVASLARAYKKRKQAVECKSAKETLGRYGIVVK